jgi:hypothetical protein
VAGGGGAFVQLQPLLPAAWQLSFWGFSGEGQNLKSVNSLARTPLGLAVRMVGENPQAAEGQGVSLFPRLPVRQWVLSVPKRLRYFMQRDGAVLSMVLRIFLRVMTHSEYPQNNTIASPK